LKLGLAQSISLLDAAMAAIACSKKTTRKLEEVMSDVRFPEPVVLEFSTGKRQVATSYEAIECLHQQWPEWARGRSWRSAYRACRDALDGWRNPAGARRTFLKAARRAGLLANDCHTLPRRKSNSVKLWKGVYPEPALNGWR
jgi:hypothetical protein